MYENSGIGVRIQSERVYENPRNPHLRECQRRGLDLIALHEDLGLSAKNLKRPALATALSELDSGQGSVLMVSKLDRLTRSVHDATALMAKAEQSGWGLVALDAPVDTTTPQGAAMAQVLAVFAELERRLIGERTKAALAVRKSQGMRLGRPQTLPLEMRNQILSMRQSGLTLRAIASELNRDGVPTSQGGEQWWPATIRAIILSARDST